MMMMLSVAHCGYLVDAWLADQNETRLVWKCDFYIFDIHFNCGAFKC